MFLHQEVFSGDPEETVFVFIVRVIAFQATLIVEVEVKEAEPKCLDDLLQLPSFALAQLTFELE